MSYVRLDKQLYFGIYPGIVFPDIKVDNFIGLTEDEKKEKITTIFKCPIDANCKKFPIVDRKAIDVKQLSDIVDYILSLEGTTYIYCKGGHGRSGMIASAVYGKKYQLSGEQSLQHINTEWKKQRDMNKLSTKVKKLGAPQTLSQKNVVKKYLNYGIPNIDPNINIVKFYTKGKSLSGEECDPKYVSFSNFYKVPNGILIDNSKWSTVEHYFQAMKFSGTDNGPKELRNEYMKLISKMNTPNKAFLLGQIGRKNKDGSYKKISNYYIKDKKTVDYINQKFIGKISKRSDWDKVSISIMIHALTCKFTQNDKLRKLITGVPDNSYIVEHTSRDKIWADGGDGGTGKIGKNYLGKILTSLSFVLKYKNCKNMSRVLKNKITIE